MSKAPTKKRELQPTSAYPIETRSKRAKRCPVAYTDEQSRLYRKATLEDKKNVLNEDEQQDVFYIELARGQKPIPEPKWPEVGTIVSLKKKKEDETIELAHVDFVGYDNQTKSTYVVLTFMQ